MSTPTETYDGMKKHVDPTISESDFMDSTRTIIYAATEVNGRVTPFRKVGVVQSFAWSERKDLQQIYELGSDMMYQITGKTQGSLSISRILISGKDLLNALYHGDVEVSPENFIASISQMNAPLHLMFHSVSASGGQNPKGYTRIFANCHIVSRQESIGAGQRIIMEQCAISYSHIADAKMKPL